MKPKEAKKLREVLRQLKVLKEELPSRDDLADLKAGVDSIRRGLKAIARIATTCALECGSPYPEELGELGPLADKFTEALVMAFDPDFPDGSLDSRSQVDSVSCDKRAGCGLTGGELLQVISGKRTEAIKLLSDRTGLDLQKATDHVESFGADYYVRIRNGG